MSRAGDPYPLARSPWTPDRQEPAMTDIDPVAVSRACAGDRTVSLNRAEVAAAVAHLHAKGSNQRETARTLGLHERTVARIVHGETTVPQSRPGRVS